MATYIVSYTLKEKDNPNTFVDYWHRFADDTEEINRQSALKFYTKILVENGGADPYELYTISLSKELLSSEESGEVMPPIPETN